jgi:hypothetical protein
LLFSLNDEVVKHDPETWWLHAHPDFMKEAAKHVVRGDKVSKLKWILSKTMGSPIAFDSRQSELQELGLPHDDDSVLKSFLDLVSPPSSNSSSPFDGGLLWKYLQYGQIALRFGDTLFIHGGLHEHTIG